MTVPVKHVRQVLLVTLLSALFYAVSAAWTGIGEVWSSLGDIGFMGWTIILSLSLFNYVLRYIRWEYYLDKLGYAVPRSGNVDAFLAGFAFTTTPGKVGEAVRSFYLKPFGVGYLDSLSALFVERLADLIAMILLASLAAFAFPDMRWIVATTLIITIALIPMLHSQRLYRLVEQLRSWLTSARLQNLVGHVLSMQHTAASLLRSGPLYYGFLLGGVAWAAEGYALYVVLDRLGADVSLALAAGIYGISILAGAVSFLPGGLGGTELAMGSMLLLAGVDSSTTVAAVIICRLATLWFAVAIGLVVVAKLEVKGDSGDFTGTV
jgi:uncharacterized protein (TIRG00374 family)